MIPMKTNTKSLKEKRPYAIKKICDTNILFFHQLI